MFGETSVEHGPVGIEELAQAEIVLQHLAEKRRRLLDHALFQIVVVVGIKLPVGSEHAHATQLQPLARERVRKGVRLGVAHHAAHFRAQDVRLVQLALAREIEEPLVGHCAPKKIGETRSQFPVGERGDGASGEPSTR